MSLYVDSSALLKRYVDEPESFLTREGSLLTARHTVDVRQAQAARALGLTVVGV